MPHTVTGVLKMQHKRRLPECYRKVWKLLQGSDKNANTPVIRMPPSWCTAT